MAKRKTYDDYRRIGEDLIKYRMRAKKARTESTRKKYEDKIKSIERSMRRTANSRLRELRKEHLELDTADKLKEIIGRQKRATRYLSSPDTIDQAYLYAMAEANFLSRRMSTPSGAKEALREIREDFENSGYYQFKSDQDFQDFYVWRNENAVHDFFNLFPPSPPEMQDEVSAMAYDLFQKGGKEKQIMDSYFKAWESFQKSKGEVGISLKELRDKIFALYESEEKRKR